jgi:hypothetical protein
MRKRDAKKKKKNKDEFSRSLSFMVAVSYPLQDGKEIGLVSH